MRKPLTKWRLEIVTLERGKEVTVTHEFRARNKANARSMGYLVRGIVRIKSIVEVAETKAAANG